MDMARQINKLSATKVNGLKARGFYGDGGGLYLQVAKGGSKSWVFRYKRSGKARDMGLGSLITIGLGEARDLANDCRRQLLKGVDPLEARRAERTAQEIEAAKAITFDQCCATYIADNSVAWKSPVHRQQWSNTMATYVKPVFGSLPVQAIDTALVLKAIKPIWNDKPETASRVRGRIETVLNWAKARGYRRGDNPAQWKGHLDHLLPRRSKVKAAGHHAALPYIELPAFMANLRNREGGTAVALEFTILTAARTSEALKAEWSEINFEEKVWTIPAARMKSGREHRVPLCERSLEILKSQNSQKRGTFLFPGEATNSPLSQMAMLMLLRRMGVGSLTVHGFRSTFKDWARERTAFADRVPEAALAHVSGDKVERAYARGDLFRETPQAYGSLGRLLRKSGGYWPSPPDAEGGRIKNAAKEGRRATRLIASRTMPRSDGLSKESGNGRAYR